MRQEFETGGFDIDVVGINIIGAESSQGELTSRCTFDLLQDVTSVGVWTLMGGGKDDFFIYRAGGTLAPSGYLPVSGTVFTDLSTPEGYSNVYNAVIAANRLGAGEPCGQPAGMQLPGDANQDSALNVADAIFVLSYLFGAEGDTLNCEKGADTNDSDGVDLADAISILGFIFADGPPPALGTGCLPIMGCPDACEL